MASTGERHVGHDAVAPSCIVLRAGGLAARRLAAVEWIGGVDAAVAGTGLTRVGGTRARATGRAPDPP